MSATPPNNSEPPKDDVEVERWYAALTNQPNSAARQTSLADEVPIEVVQKVLKDADQADQEREAEETKRDWQRLQFRLRKEATQEATQEASQAQKPKSASRDWLSPANRSLAMAAGVAAVMTVGILVNGTGLDDPGAPRGPAGSGPTIDGTVMRGAKTEILRSSDPEQESKKLQSALQGAGTQADMRKGTESIVLDIVLTRPVKPAVAQVLEKYNLPVPEQGNLSVQFIK